MFYYCENSAPSLPYLNSLSDTFRTVTYISHLLSFSILIIAIYAAVKHRKTDKKTTAYSSYVIIISVISIAVSAVISLSLWYCD